MSPLLRTLLLSLSSVFLLVVAFRVPHGWPVVFVALIPFLHAITLAPSWRSAVSAGALVGAGIMGTGTFWVFSAVPIDAVLPLSPMAFIVLMWFLMMLSGALCVGLWAYWVHRFPLQKPLYIGLAAILFVGAEYVRMIVTNIAVFAPTVRNPPFFSAGFLGYPLADSESFLQFASFGGIWLLSLIVVAVNIALYRIVRNRGTRTFLYIGAIVFLISIITLLPLASWRTILTPVPGATVSVGLVSASPDSVAGLERELPQAIESMVAEGADIILLPEAMALYSPEFVDRRASLKAPVIVGSFNVPVPGGGRYLYGYASAPEGKELTPLRGKTILTPQGEYVPAVFSWLLNLTSIGKDLNYRAFRFGLRNAPASGVPVEIAGVHATLIFCFEAFAPGFAADLVRKQGSDVLLISASHAGFSHSRSLEQDTLRYAKVRTLEAGVPSVTSTKAGPAFALDRFGQTLASITSDNGIESKVVKLQRMDQ